MDTDEKTISEEHRRLASLEPPMWCKAAALVERTIIRVLRLLVTAGIAAIAIWLFQISANILGEPFASLSPLDLIGGIVAGIAGLLVIGISMLIALGPKGQSAIEQNWRENQANPRKLRGYED